MRLPGNPAAGGLMRGVAAGHRQGRPPRSSDSTASRRRSSERTMTCTWRFSARPLIPPRFILISQRRVFPAPSPPPRRPAGDRPSRGPVSAPVRRFAEQKTSSTRPRPGGIPYQPPQPVGNLQQALLKGPLRIRPDHPGRDHPMFETVGIDHPVAGALRTAIDSQGIRSVYCDSAPSSFSAIFRECWSRCIC